MDTTEPIAPQSNLPLTVEQRLAVMDQAYHLLQRQLTELRQQQQQAPEPHIKMNKPPMFHGRPGESVEDWIFALEQYFSVVPIRPGRQILFAASYLQGSAATWWRQRFELNTPSSAITWDVFTAGLRAQFRPINAAKLARDRLATIRQVTSVADYVARFQNIMLDLPNMDEEDRIDRFLRGLKSHVQESVALQQPTSILKAYALANTVDSIRYQQRLSNTQVRPNNVNRTNVYRPTPARSSRNPTYGH
jgi:Retrotransposon gag protein